ncbi:MAG: hypothetical protein LBM93_09495 [Oscillospiraceae bacterium]|jgi:hypothetical protein|nr:hypothetical protein [Oscillospiraceae bacterium]
MENNEKDFEISDEMLKEYISFEKDLRKKRSQRDLFRALTVIIFAVCLYFSSFNVNIDPEGNIFVNKIILFIRDNPFSYFSVLISYLGIYSGLIFIRNLLQD